MRYLAEAPPGFHPTVQVCGLGTICTINVDSVVSSGIAMLITLLVGFLVAYRVSHGTPGKLQMVFELMIDYTRRMVRETVAPDAGFVAVLAMTLGFYILVANWIDFFPLPAPYVIPAMSDVNQTAALAILVFVLASAYSIRVLGLRGYLRRFTKPFDLNPLLRFSLFLLVNIIEEVAKPLSLALRLFGNIFAGAVMVYLIALLFPIYIAPIPLVIWKLFDVFFVGTIQAFIFLLLTVIYFGQAREGSEEEEGHGSHRVAHGAPQPSSPA